MEKGRSTAIIAHDEKRFFNGLFFIGREEDIIQTKAYPVEEGDQGPDRIKKCKEDDAFTCQASRSVVGFEEGAICHTPEKAKVIGHEGFVSFRLG